MMTEVNVEFDTPQDTVTFEEIECGKFFIFRNDLFIKTDSHINAINVRSGDEWEIDKEEHIRIPTTVNIYVEE